MDLDAVLAAFDEQVRRDVRPDAPGDVVEHDGSVVCRLSAHDWSGVTWSSLDDASADAAIGVQLERFQDRRWEWKHYSYDQPADLPARLIAAGFVAEPAEALLVAELSALDFSGLSLDVDVPAGLELRDVRDAGDVADLVAVHDEVFGGDHAAIGQRLLAGLGLSTAAVVAYDGAKPVAAGRIEFYAGTDFAGLWGGGTVSGWRGRGLFRALVAHRASLAATRGLRYLQVDASPESEPILRRLGFEKLATTTPFVWPAGR
jgi:hypothetical protein